MATPEPTDVDVRYLETKEENPRRRETIFDANAKLHLSLESLTASVNELLDALEPVTRHDEDATAVGLKSVINDGLSPTQDTIRAAIDIVQTLTIRVDARRYRLDI